MKSVVKIIGAADGMTRTPFDGKYVVDWNPHVLYGELFIQTTDKESEARIFEDAKEALDEWQAISELDPLRPDGRPNRPLTAVHIVVLKAKEEGEGHAIN